MPIIGAKGSPSSGGFGQFAQSGAVNYIEDVFSCFLYTGNGGTLAINNGVDLAGKGGLVWTKKRDSPTENHVLVSNATGLTINDGLSSNNTSAKGATSNGLGTASFNSNGYTIGSNALNPANGSGFTYASWTFREQPKFFDVVTVTGQPTETTFNHNLGSVPGCVIIKVLNGTGDWFVYHRSTGSSQYLILNSTAGPAAFTDWCVVTSTTVTVKGGAMGNGNPHVVYLFAHDAGGFGLTGTDNVISCGSYTGNGSGTGPVVTLGYEPQWLMVKNASGTGNWQMMDSMRGMSVGLSDATLQANLANAETSAEYVSPTATGFQITSTSSEVNTNASTYIYIAIRRPMKVPQTGLSVLNVSTSNGLGIMATNTGITNDFNSVNDAVILRPYRTNTTAPSWVWSDSLRGYSSAATPFLNSSSTNAESTTTLVERMADNYLLFPGATFPAISYTFRRAPGFFDQVCYTGTGAGGRDIDHNLSVLPELLIIKSRNYSDSWMVGSQHLNNNETSWTNPWSHRLSLNTNEEKILSDVFGQQNSQPTSNTASTFRISSDSRVNTSGQTYVAYLFASCPGVSKVGSYTGNGTTQVINCGFTEGARFVLIKRTDSTGDWYVWDSARGIVDGNDPYLLLNSTAAEVTNTDFVDTAATGFEISSTAPAAINASGGTFIFLAIA